MLILKPRRILTIGAVGAALSGLATYTFDLPVHAGLAIATGPARYLIATACGAVCAVLVDHALHDYGPFGP